MKRIIALGLLLVCGLAEAQTYNKFKPANGVLKGATTTYVTTPAAFSDITSLWSGTCDNTTFLRGDGACASPGGGGGTPGGANTNIQYNNSGAFGGDANLTWNASTQTFQVSGAAATRGLLAIRDGNTGNRIYELIAGRTGAGEFSIFDTIFGGSVFEISSSQKISARGAFVNGGLVDFTPDSGNFTGTFSGFASGTLSGTVRWYRIGPVVTILFPGGTFDTSNATTFTMSGLPSAIQPTSITQQCALGVVEDNGITIGGGAAEFAAGSGTVTFYNNGNSSGWTAANNKGFPNSHSETCSYLVQ